MEQALWTVLPRVNSKHCGLAWVSMSCVRNQRFALMCIIVLHDLRFGSQNYESSFLAHFPRVY